VPKTVGIINFTRKTEMNNIIFWAIVLYITGFISFWSTVLYLKYLDIYTNNIKNKIQYIKIEKERYNIETQILLNHILIDLPCSFVISYLWYLRGIDSSFEINTNQIPRLIVTLLFTDIMFYYTHRLFHTPYFYKHFHKKHHLQNAPCAIDTTYAHPLEHVISNISTLYIPPIISGLNIWVTIIYNYLSISSVICSHSGYKHMGAERHDAHHKFFNVNYGPLKLCDWLHGTEMVYKHPHLH
jgi:sterol desaturase/sphingolipid hydroxylase (fatty acid hydroxylase superfamily)